MKIVKRHFIVKLLSPLEKEEKQLGNALDYILKNNFLLTPLNDIIIRNNNKVAPHYEFSQKYLNIPLDYSIEFKSLYKGIEFHLKDKASEYIIFHEIGHAVQHSSIKEKNYSFEPIETNSALNYLFNGSAIAKKINHFLADNYKESYADCYAAYVIYQKYNDISIFDNIYEYRKKEKQSLKNTNPFDVNEYFNFESLKILKLSLQDNKSYQEVHNIINDSIIRSFVFTIAEEIKYNDSFLKELNEYGKEFNKDNGVKGFLEEIKKRSKINLKTEIDEILNNKDTFRDTSYAKPLNSIRVNGHNFILANIEALRINSTIIATLKL